MRKRELGWALAASAVWLFVARPASAEPFTKKQVQLALGVAYGVYLGEAAEEIPSPYGFGIGARAGYTLGMGIYLGGEANYFFGASRRFPEYGDVEGKLQILHYGVEAGYDLGLGRNFVLRPKVGVGAARVTAELRVEGNTGDVHEVGLALTAGAQALIRLDPILLSFEARYSSLDIETEPLQQIPGLDVEDEARLDGLLFFAGVGYAF